MFKLLSLLCYIIYKEQYKSVNKVYKWFPFVWFIWFTYLFKHVALLWQQSVHSDEMFEEKKSLAIGTLWFVSNPVCRECLLCFVLKCAMSLKQCIVIQIPRVPVYVYSHLYACLFLLETECSEHLVWLHVVCIVPPKKSLLSRKYVVKWKWSLIMCYLNKLLLKFVCVQNKWLNKRNIHFTCIFVLNL